MGFHIMDEFEFTDRLVTVTEEDNFHMSYVLFPKVGDLRKDYYSGHKDPSNNDFDTAWDDFSAVFNEKCLELFRKKYNLPTGPPSRPTLKRVESGFSEVMRQIYEPRGPSVQAKGISVCSRTRGRSSVRAKCKSRNYNTETVANSIRNERA